MNEGDDCSGQPKDGDDRVRPADERHLISENEAHLAFLVSKRWFGRTWKVDVAEPASIHESSYALPVPQRSNGRPAQESSPDGCGALLHMSFQQGDFLDGSIVFSQGVVEFILRIALDRADLAIDNRRVSQSTRSEVLLG